MLGFYEDGWVQVRHDMLTELNNFLRLYQSVYESSKRLKNIRPKLNYFDGGLQHDK